MKEIVKLEAYNIEQLVNLSGVKDENLEVLEDHFQVEISLRGDEMSIVGSQQQIEKTKKVIYSLLKLIVSGVSISRRDVIYAQKLVEKEKIQTDFINLEEGHSRINVKILEDEKETAINSKGPLVDNKSIEKLYQKLSNLKENDILVLSGSIPKGIKEDIYEEICEKIKDKNVKIVVDSTKKLLLNTLKYRPFLIKPNHHELGEIFNVQILNQDQAIEYAKKLQQKGAQNVLVSMGEKGSILLDENGKSYKKAAISNKNVINTVGAGDSMVAGYLAGYLNYKNHEDALKLGIASASATVNNVFLGTKDEINEYFNSF